MRKNIDSPLTPRSSRRPSPGRRGWSGGGRRWLWRGDMDHIGIHSDDRREPYRFGTRFARDGCHQRGSGLSSTFMPHHGGVRQMWKRPGNEACVSELRKHVEPETNTKSPPSHDETAGIFVVVNRSGKNSGCSTHKCIQIYAAPGLRSMYVSEPLSPDPDSCFAASPNR